MPLPPAEIRMTLEDLTLWNAFNHINTEMIITKDGRRMFPACKVSVSGLHPSALYTIFMELIPEGDFKYKWRNEQWECSKTTDPQPQFQTYMHPDSPAPGCHWMHHPLSFSKIKLTNRDTKKPGHVILRSMYRYHIHFHVIPLNYNKTPCWKFSRNFTFPETTFTAVTAYQNPQIIRLKIEHNPFAKGFREGGSHSLRRRARRSALEMEGLSRTSPSLQRMPCTYQSAQAEENQASTQQSSQGVTLSAPALEQSSSHHIDPLIQQECNYSHCVSVVPASPPHQPYRSEYPTFLFPSSGINDAQIPFYLPPNPFIRYQPSFQQHGYHHQNQNTMYCNQNPCPFSFW